MQKAIDNKFFGVSPQKPGGSALPSHPEKKFAVVVRNLRAKKFPVFREDTLKWAEDAIAGTDYAAYFEKGKPTIGWYKGWLKRIEFTTGVLRPLEQTRAEWNTPENLETYFEVAKGVLLDAGVVVYNPGYYPTEELLITRPERICSYDETIVELDCTKGGAGKPDRAIRVRFNDDDGEVVVTKLDKCASAACGRLSDGRALPVYMCSVPVRPMI
jgi:hypothetical protein